MVKNKPNPGLQMDSTDQILEQIKAAGQAEDESIAIGTTALQLAALDHPGIDITPYLKHLDQLADDARERFSILRRGMSESESIARVLADTIANRHGYMGDNDTFDDPQNADIIRVIDRRRGLPVSLGIIYLDIAHRMGATAQGLNTPGHFLLSIGEGEQAKVLDPFNGGVVLNLDELRPWPPTTTHTSPDYGPVGRREVLLRLLNNIRTRALASKDMVRSLTIAERMVLISPRQPELWLDLSRANEAVGKLKNAIHAAQSCISISGNETAAGREATFALASLRRRLN
jgi:regulator of sirC expression with transglutaminase-like and TPR domain